ncbi:cardiolipin synthetase [Buchnera aphidicola (Schlechtendalia chinensis)]|uniref:Cardiolipin synthase A n=1 Tax=Buchnera aphidicola subsp. Schlechtendalia chinensis TaxID=118110 RepID=A0A172WDI0_BUCSC|nr:cardiolipin synthase [Buchnera aphidicola]ANF17038.1 cardiolipin synthetase [Buchnera aphidicola (Schlechtendalia chinensis)]
MIHFYPITTLLTFLGYWLLIITITLRIFSKRREIPSAMAWLLIIYVFPIIGIIVWFFLKEFYLGKRRLKLANSMWSNKNTWLKNLKSHNCIFENKNSEVATSVFQLCKHRQGISGIKYNKLKLLKNTEDIIKDLIKDIYLAKNNIEIVFYIWKPGGLADDVARALIKSSKKGIKCRVMLDSAGSIEFFRSKWVYIMKNSGIQIVEALKLNLYKIFCRRIDLRQHRKFVLIDNYITYVGSMNLVDPNIFKKQLKIGKWIDLMIRIEGPVATTMGMVYSCDWEIETGKKIFPKKFECKNYNFPKRNHSAIQIIASGPGFTKNIIHQVLLTSIYSARKKIIMTTPYLVPSDDLLYAICSAAQRGIEVILIIPKSNNSILVKWASRVFFSELLESGVKIYQFKKGLLHSKSVLIDMQLSLIGTANLDMRSLWLNFEITLVVDDSKFGKNLFVLQNEYISNSTLVDPKIWAIRSFWKKILEKIFYFLSPIL